MGALAKAGKCPSYPVIGGDKAGERGGAEQGELLRARELGVTLSGK